LVCTTLAFASARLVSEHEAAESMSAGLRAEVEAHAEMVADINAAADQLRAERAADMSGVGKFWCKTIKQTDQHSLGWITKFMNSKYGKWVPKTQKSLSVYLQAEANAAAFVGVSGGVGVGVDFTLDTTGAGATGQIRFFACLSGAISVGYIGGKVTGGAGLYVGFGKDFGTSIGEATMEIAFDIPTGVPVTVGIGILVHLGDSDKKGFIKGWIEYQKKHLPPAEASKKQIFVSKAKDLAGRIISGFGQELKAFCPNIRVTGIALHVGAGVGAGFSTEVAVDVEPLIKGLKAGCQAAWKKFGPIGATIADKIRELKTKLSKTKASFQDLTEATDSGGKPSGGKPSGGKPSGGGKPKGKKK